MEGLLTVRQIPILAMLVVGGLTAAVGQEHCSLVVRVVNSDGQDVEAVVRVEEQSGRFSEAENEIGGVRFCDLGIRPVTVTVGKKDTCNLVVVHNVPLRWRNTTRLKVVQDREDCLIDKPPEPVPGCEVLFRFVDEDGDPPLSEIRLTVEGENEQQRSLVADRFGRVYMRAKYGVAVYGTVHAAGYALVEVGATCSRATPVVEQLVTLERPISKHP